MRRYLANLDLALIGVWLVLRLTLFATATQPGALALDLATCAAVVLAVWRPLSGIVLLGICLAGYLVAPADWQTLGQYLLPIAIVGAGLRDQRRERLVLTAVALVWLPVLVWYQAAGSDGPFVTRSWLAWLGLIAFAWLIGDSYAAAVRAREESRKAAVLADRQALARELHDSAARTLALTSLRAQKLQANQPSEDLDAVIDGIDLANQQLRWTLNIMKDTDAQPTAASAPNQVPLAETLQAGVNLLRKHGHEVILTVQGNLAKLDPGRAAALADAANEAIANMVRHGDPSRPSSIMATVEPELVELVFVNHPRAQTADSGNSMGLSAVQDRLQTLGGRLDTQEGPNSWLTRVLLPQNEARHTTATAP